MLAQLVALNDGCSILLDKPILLLGRHPECDIQIDSRKVSRRHCCIALVSDYLVVRDLGSTNGIRINGARVMEGKLHAGDELTIGSFRYQVRWGAPENDEFPAPASPPASPRARLDDEDLEACEEPVPLEDPPSPLPLPAAEQRPDRLPAQNAAAPFVLPDHIDLAPASDIAPPRRRLPPPPA